MLEMSWITAMLQLYSQVPVLFGNVIVKRINKRLFDLLARFHYILNLPRNDNTLITRPTNGLEFYTIYRTKDQGLIFRMVHKTLFNLSYLLSFRSRNKANICSYTL